MSIREISAGRQVQGANEMIAYTLDVTRWGAIPASPAMAVYDMVSGAAVNVTGTIIQPGTPSVAGNVITWPPIGGMIVDHLYFVLMTFVIAGNTRSAYALIQCER